MNRMSLREYFSFLVYQNAVDPEKAKTAAIRYYKDFRPNDNKKDVEEFNRWFDQNYGRKLK